MEEKTIIRKLIDGDNDAYSELFFRYEKYVFAIVKRLVKIDADAEEITQDVFFKVYKGISGFKEESKLSSWLYTIARNLSLNRLRDTKKERVLRDDLTELTAISTRSPEAEFEVKHAMELIESLPEKYKKILGLYYFQSKSYKEISLILNMPINTVKINILRAKKQAAKIIKKE